MSDGCAMVETVVRGIREASLTMFIKSTDAANLITELTAENAKLRRIVKDMASAFFALDTDRCQTCSHGNRLYPCPQDTVVGGECLFRIEMRELGIEVE